LGVGVSFFNINLRTSAITISEVAVANVDWALLNFMQDWFPLESREKLKMNEMKATEEEMKETVGVDPGQTYVVM